MSISKGAPLRAFSTIAVLWILGRFAWEAVSPSVELQPMRMPMAEPKERLAHGSIAGKLSAPLLFLPDQSTRVMAGSGHPEYKNRRVAFDVRPNFWATDQSNLLPDQSPSPQKHHEQLKPSAMVKRAFLAPPRRILNPNPGTNNSSSSKPFSGYFWVFAREADGSEHFGQTVPRLQSPGGQYGASQAGAILTYRLTGHEKRNLSAFVRASTALSSAGEEEIAVGMRVKPLAEIPISLFAEQRVGAGAFRNRGTAFYLAGGTGPERFLFDTSLESYGQAGYIFAEDSSYFFDASATVQRKILERGNYKITAGGGIWAGGQEGLRRLDLGPRVNLYVPVGELEMRFSLDWRQRVGGNAVPDSGVALTATTGF